MASIIKVDTIQTAAGGTPTAADLGLNTTGSVLQVVSYTFDTTVSATNADVHTHITEKAFTPLNATSNILILMSAGGVVNGGSGRMALRLYRDSVSGGVTGTKLGEQQVAQDSDQTNGISHANINGFISNVGSTDTIYFKYTIQKYDGSTTWRVNWDQSYTQMTIIEIAG